MKNITRNACLFFLIGVILICLAWKLLPFQFMSSNELADNAQGCPYYITLQSILSNYSLLSADKANAKFIKQRLSQFETDIDKAGAYKVILSGYRNFYYNKLRDAGLVSINDTSDLTLIVQLAKNTAQEIDNFYLDPRLFCANPLYQWSTVHARLVFPAQSRRILQYNLGNLYDHLPNRFMRILGTAQDDFQLGVFSGYFVHNQTSSLNTPFMTGVPLLTALYVIPGNNFSNLGTYNAAVPWNSFFGEFLTNPMLRKILDIGGVDVFTIESTDLSYGKVPGVVPLPSHINNTFSLGRVLKPYINTQSYGMAYLANHIHYMHKGTIDLYENSIKYYFAKPATRDSMGFIRARNALYGELNQLTIKHDIILETSVQLPPTDNLSNVAAGDVQIKGIVGERAMFISNCLRDHCTLVFNFADSPGWHARVNGIGMPINRANFAFMATTVPKGRSIIWFIYQPLTSLLAYLMSIISLIFILLL